MFTPVALPFTGADYRSPFSRLVYRGGRAARVYDVCHIAWRDTPISSGRGRHHALFTDPSNSIRIPASGANLT